MSPSHERRERYIRYLIDTLPGRIRHAVHWLREPSGRWVRRPAALIFLAGGTVGFLPILGYWMIPLGLLLLADDVPPLKRWLVRVIRNGRSKWRNHNRRRRDESR